MFDWITEIGYLGWFAIGVIFAIAEMFVPGTYLIWFGFASFTMGALVSVANLTPTEILVVFALFSAAYSAFGWWVYSKILKKNADKNKYLNDMAGSYINRVYQLSQDVVDGRSKAKVGDTFWLVETEDEDLNQGDKVRVVGVQDGVILKVEKYEKK